ncbi:hypothetical protein CXF72_06495 [Psychromonas sp. MB-3u-54]|nr:hypothetical protein CXF72_06495 [Psychromonas sp. MB-3u-54]
MHKMHPTDNYSARNSKQLAARKPAVRKLEARKPVGALQHGLPLFAVHKMHPTDNYSARNSKQLEARSSKARSSKPEGCALSIKVMNHLI